MGVTAEIALEMAINGFQIRVLQLKEGDLAKVDFSQSLADNAGGPNATTTSLPGCGKHP